MVKTSVEKNDVVVLIDEKGKKILVDTSSGTTKFKNVGVLNPASLVGKDYGVQVEIGTKRFWVLTPSLPDKLQSLRRRAQIILPRDASHIVMNCGIESGQRVLEAGIGSGSLTIALATAVAPGGQVISYDVRQDFIDHALMNITNAGLDHLVLAKLQDVTQGIDEVDVDAVVVDIPNPWDMVEAAWKALKIGGYFCSYSPLVSQVEKTVDALKRFGFIEVRTVENLQREMVVGAQGTRPSFDMLGHTGYLSFARKIRSF